MPPVALIQSVETVRRRARGLSVVYGVGVVVAAAFGLMLAVILIDWLLNLHSVPRVLAMFAALGGLGYLVYRFVVTPALAALSLSDVAGRLERAFPQFEDRLRSTIDFVEGRNPGSGALQQRVMDQAAEISRNVDLSQAVIAKPAIISAGGAALAAVLMLSLAIAMGGSTLSIIASRFLTPWNAAAWPKRVQINVTSFVPERVPVGQKVEVVVRLDRGDKPTMRPVLYYQLDGGPQQQMYLTRGPDGQYRGTIDARLEKAADGAAAARGAITARVSAGDDEHALPTIAVVPRLAIKAITADVTPPPYVTGRAPTQIDLAAVPVVTAEGSGVSVTVHFNKGLAQADAILEPVGEAAVAPAATWSRPDAQTAVAKFVAVKSTRFRVRATDIDGFGNSALEEYELNVRPDTNLTIQLETPRRSEERTPNAFVPLQAIAEDDCGIEWVKLVVERLPPRGGKWEIPLVDAAAAKNGVTWQAVEATAERVRDRLNYQWELAPLQTQPGDVLEFQLLAKDNFKLGDRAHDPVGTSKLRVTIISPEDMIARVTGELPASKTLAQNLRSAETRNQQETRQLADDTKEKPQLDAADRAALERLAQQQSSTAASTKQLSDRMDQSLDKINENRLEAPDVKNLLTDVKNTLARTSEEPMKDAAQSLSDANQGNKPQEQRKEDLANAGKNQQKAIQQLDGVMAKLESVGSLQTAIADVKNLLEAQRKNGEANKNIAKTNLGKTPEQMSEADRKKLDEIADEQAKLGDKTDKVVDALNKQAKTMEKSDPTSADALKAAAQKAQESKVSQNQRRAAEQTKQNQQAAAQGAQQQVELGLQQMLSELNEAERRQLAHLQEKLAELKEQVAILIRRQAGHNLDNLTIQGPDRVKAEKKDSIDNLRGLAQRPADEKVDAKNIAQLGQLTPAQELTEHNARDLGQSAEAQPETADAAAALGKAAGKMERAIVSLRASKPTEAYDPSQVDALAALVDAAKIIEEQKQKADAKAEQEQAEAIRKRYEKVRETQVAINTDTTRVEKSRDKTGAIARLETATVRKLPDQQQKLSEEIAKIGEDLDKIGSVVYVWANNDIKSTMEQIKGDLGDLKTGAVTQTQQEGVVAQLDAMIKNLAERKKEGKFEQAGGGGGEGGGAAAPKMPAEAELRLLKSLQQVVNGNTLKLAAAAKKDKESHANLGQREGELRNVLASLLEKAGGDMKLGPEPDNKDQLPEEAKADDVEEGEIKDLLLGDGGAEKKIEQDFKLVGTRMARVRQRLAINADSGKTTQEIESRILKDLDVLIETAAKSQQQQQQQMAKGGKPGEPKPKPGEGQQQANNHGANKPGGQKPQPGQAQAKGGGEGGNTGSDQKADLSKDIRASAESWGNVTSRVRDAVIESKDEVVIDQYRKLIEDYYEALAKSGGAKAQ